MSWFNIIKSSGTDILFDELLVTLEEYHPHLRGNEKVKRTNAYQINMTREAVNSNKTSPESLANAFNVILSVLKRHHRELVEKTGENIHSARNVDFIATIEEIIGQLISEVKGNR